MPDTACAQAADEITPEELRLAARRAYSDGDWLRAEQIFQQLADAAPEDGNTRFELARTQYRLKKYAAAWLNFQAAEKFKATASHQALWTGFTAFKLDRWEETDAYLAQVAPEDVTDEVRLKRAIAQFNLSRESAPRELEELARQPTAAGAVARYYFALTRENSGDPAGAFDLYAELQRHEEPFRSAAEGRLRALQPPAWAFRLELSCGYDSRPIRINDDTNRSGAAPDGFMQGSFRFSVRPFYPVGRPTPVIYWLSLSGFERLYTRRHQLDYAIVGVMQSLENSPERTWNFRIDNAFRRHWLGAAPYFDQAKLSGAFQWRRRQAGWLHAVTLAAAGDLTQATDATYEPQEGTQGSLSAAYAAAWQSADWSCTIPGTLTWQQRDASLPSEDYHQSGLQLAPSVTLGQWLLLAAAVEVNHRTYRADASNAGRRRREWPAIYTASLELPLWTHSSIQGNFQFTEQAANQAAYRYTNRQIWLSLYVWF